MIAPDTLLAFAAVALVIIVIPGPGVLYVIGRALQHGTRPAVVSAVGQAGGPVLHAVVVALGVGALIAASEAAFVVLKVAGGLYLVWLGVQAFRHRGARLAVTGDDAPVPPARRLLGESLVVGVSNPKTLVFIAAVLPQFVDPGRGAVGAQIVALGVTFALIGIASDSVYALAGGAARDWFARSPGRLATIRGGGGVAMAVLGLVLLLSRRAA
ncbi:LysE family translocator [Demequina soli]|uniref:LysE family translocator n=1 Tax=Demequina soli TaxID=1638987 RepID=UPI0007833D75|nr:LysE family translocator [Demequina soli]